MVPGNSEGSVGRGELRDVLTDRQENTNIHSEAARVTYLILIILWIILGMGYIFAVVDVMADTFRSTR